MAAQRRLRVTDLALIRQGLLPSVEQALRTAFPNLPGVRDREGKSLKFHVLQRADVDVRPTLDRLGLTLVPADLDDATRIIGPHLLPRLQSFHAMGTDLTVPFPDGSTVLHRLVRGFTMETPEALDWLLALGVPATLRDADGSTALHVLVNAMPSLPSSRTAADPVTGPTMIGMALGLSSTETQAMYVHMGVVRHLQEAWVERLIAAGCNPHDRNDRGLSVFDLVQRQRQSLPIDQMARAMRAPALVEQRRETYADDNLQLIERLEALVGLASTPVAAG